MVPDSIVGFFLSPANPKFKRIKFMKNLTSSGPYSTKCKNRGFPGDTFVFK